VTIDPAPKTEGENSKCTLLFVVNELYFFFSHRKAVAKVAMDSGFEVHVAAPVDHVWAPEGFSYTAIEDLGFTVHPIPMSRRGTNPFQDFFTLISLLRLYRRVRPDLVHHLTIKPIIYGGIAARLTGVPGVVSAVTGLGQIFVAYGFGAALLRRLVVELYRIALGHRNGRVIVQNKIDGDVLNGLLGGGRIELIRGSGASLTDFPAQEPAHGTPIVILPARLLWEKGVGEFAEAAKRLKKQGVEARFALVGDTQPSNPRSVPQEQIESWVAEGHIEWWGRRNDMASVFAECEIVCLPSTYGEGVPKVLIEAAASARTIVSTDVPGCLEIARHEENALIVPQNDIDALTKTLRRALGSRDMCRRFGKRGREIAVAEFDERQVAARTLDIYRSLLDEARSR